MLSMESVCPTCHRASCELFGSKTSCIKTRLPTSLFLLVFRVEHCVVGAGDAPWWWHPRRKSPRLSGNTRRRGRQLNEIWRICRSNDKKPSLISNHYNRARGYIRYIQFTKWWFDPILIDFSVECLWFLIAYKIIIFWVQFGQYGLPARALYATTFCTFLLSSV